MYSKQHRETPLDTVKLWASIIMIVLCGAAALVVLCGRKFLKYEDDQWDDWNN